MLQGHKGGIYGKNQGTCHGDTKEEERKQVCESEEGNCLDPAFYDEISHRFY